MRTTRNENRTVCEHDRLFFSKKKLDALVEKAGTPFYLYDEKGLRSRAKSLFAVFSEISNLNGYFPVHICPRREILEIIAETKLGAYCVTPDELRLALQCGFSSERIIFAPMTMQSDLADLLCELNVELLVVNPKLLDGVLPKRLTLACSPVKTVRNNFTQLGYHRAPLGLTRAEVMAAIPQLSKNGHDLGYALVESMNITDEKHVAAKLSSLLKYEKEMHEATGVHVRRLHLGEGPGIRYNRLNPPMDIEAAGKNAALLVKELDIDVSMNFGKVLLEPCGVFVTSVLDIIYRERPTVVVDATTTQMVPSQIDRYRHVSIVGKDWVEGRILCDIIGSRALTGDWFAERRILPEPAIGDFVVIHDAGCAQPQGIAVAAFLLKKDGTMLRLQHSEE